ncbi:Gfo/Idh/MocA family oxidoreductase [Neobacillus sp. MM2021_6]|uniref:Gfo/Idh/MocA family protein n=1 Tax=Bacillaceae TaxID=186817 RepID=UPI00140CC5A3|nr:MULTISPECIES: Gfo/Idh/MocA family oxidoreductase [Bacillaceae]MBO0959749.1 Gfo/Idh/MocA family oxidoreductase [Neobacillus sp. MM2021_6]NHC19171.1 Gfo/Idh/MocA family oxidoreductase [Bacillus sp. MM2020_4]
MKKLRVGIIGVGGIAQGRHIPAFLQLSNQCELTAVSDVNVERAKEIAEKHSIPYVFENYRELFSNVDAVCICTPNKFHAEITIAAFEAGVHVLCEKPMALSAIECEAMIAASKKAGKILAIAYHYRFMKEVQAAKMVMEEVGKPLVVRVQALRRRKVPGWGVFTNKDLQGGGSLIDFGCHLLDLALWLMGNPKHIEVSGTTYNALSKIPNQVNQWGTFDHETFNVDDHVTAYMKFENGASMLFETSWAANIKDDCANVSISGVDGGINVFPFELYTTKNGMLLNSEAAWIPGEEDPDIPQARNFIDACLGLEELVVKPEEALQVSQIIDRIYESGRNTL